MRLPEFIERQPVSPHINLTICTVETSPQFFRERPHMRLFHDVEVIAGHVDFFQAARDQALPALFNIECRSAIVARQK